jgi:dCMP deaminase
MGSLSHSRPSKDELFMGIAELASRRSHCRKAQVGCVLTDWGGTSLSLGYNGLAAGGPNDCGVDEGPCDCVHAEANALAKANRPPGVLTAYVTYPPCATCAVLLVNANVRRILVGALDHALTPKQWKGRKILLSGGVMYEFADPYKMLTNEAL